MTAIKDQISVQHTWTATALAAAGNYTSDWQMVKLWPLEPHLAAFPATLPVVHNRMFLRGHAASDVISVVNGFIVEHSLDGVNVTYQDFMTLNAAVPLAFNVMLVGKYVRINFTNGAGAQAAFSLVAWLDGV